MSYKRCCVPRCSGTEGVQNVLHEFPNPAKDMDRFKKWLSNIGGDILTLTNEFIYKNRRVCRLHFEPKFHCRNNRLSNIALPTINMPSLNYPASNEQRPLRQLQNLPNDLPTSSTIGLNYTVTTEQDTSRQLQNLPSSSTKVPIATPALDPKLPSIKEGMNRNQRTNTTRKNVMMMTKPENDIYKELVSVKRKLCKYKNKLSKQAVQIKLAKRLTSNPASLKVMEKMSPSAKIFTMLQFRELGKKAKGRRFNIKEKITALSIMKQGPKAYRFLRKIFVLPAPQTLTKLLASANIKPGINSKIFNQLKLKSADMKSDEKLCILLYDEMSLKYNISYNERKDVVTGFVTNGKETQPIFANHAQVYMIRGLYKNYKQPVSYTFSSGATKGPELASQIKEVITNLQESGFKVVATVCDQGTNNRQAIKNLINETRGDFLRIGDTPKDNVFKVNGEEIVPLYDPPHLLKGIRNNLITKALQYTMNGEVKVAKWQHLELLHKENPGYKGVRLVPKLTDNHIIPQKIGKMKVKYASQVFSATVASNMGYLADKKILPEECKNTADLLLFFDELFDSVNGSYTKKRRFAKPLLGPATPTSVHHKKWSEAKTILKSMKFINVNGKKEVVPSVTNWVWTLEGMEVLLKKLKNDFNITSVWMRHLNQDPIENFFGAIRSHGCRNTNPTPDRFESAYTALLINSLTSVHAPGGNCENDLGEALFTLITENCEADDNAKGETVLELDDLLHIELEPIETKQADPKILAPLQYVSGYFTNKTKKIFKSCDTCKNELVATQEAEYIKYREYSNRRWLCSPSESILNIVSNLQDIAIGILRKNVEKGNLKTYIKTLSYMSVDFKNISCKTHKDRLLKYLINSVIRFFIYSYCKNLNKILYGRKDMIDDVNDKYQIMARNCYVKSLKVKKK